MLSARAITSEFVSVFQDMTIRVGVSFDLLGTLVDVCPSSGHQYATDLVRFLAVKGLDSPSINVDMLEEASSKCLRAELRKDRAKWETQNLGAAKEMPIGGVTKESVLEFWSRVVDATFTADGSFCNNDETVMAIIQEAHNTAEWEEFLKSVVQRFATPEPYGWLPEALPTLKALKQWRETKLPLGIECDPPTVLTNSDYRLVSVIREMVQRDGEEALLGPVLSADNIGVGKPSPRGLELARTLSRVTSKSHWIHVGDTSEDRVAAERAGCHFVSCLSTKGPVWEELRAKLEEVCNVMQRSSSPA
ncbi:hypothetical protein TraAM80_06831 [Trypanosoma rangeli]|uniref:Haloacid dehalogenase-like hydrolase n=1 Tax=Trypanosoma rangeli TaxID=5698 RepID=A0A422N888_TRYRA|nr:uncharacterized protein TraAM80_06831 [Trypanosoma rangeli]RNF01663.1 hypothetical protein TraAM80_06831 [Trypanosoma rangeli]|eukprot:RNF01663.1 hypothetical protein TraAM80_06831 [Trypanosoma rangeli]